MTALAGGVGGAKLLVGLQQVVDPEDLTAIVNTGDDATIYGVHVSPDVDIVTYWLAGLADTDRGWGLRGDTFHTVDALGRLGADAWFSLGDRDLATCIFRTERLGRGRSLSDVTQEIAGALGVGPRVLPATDDPIRTTVTTTDGRVLAFQEYFVKERTAPEVAGVAFSGIDDAKPAPDVLDAIDACDVVVVCPSNPILSIGPIVGIAGIHDALTRHQRVIAVSPIIGGRAVKGPADRLLERLAGESSAARVAELYREWCDVFVVDRVDADHCDRVRAAGTDPVALDTLMGGPSESQRLARSVLEAASAREGGAA